MACQAIHSWTFAGLVGAFVNLTIAYLLLCASAVVFFASKFLGFLGLSLPCPCNGLQTLLMDCPKETITSVMVSVKRSFPFNSIYHEDYSLNLRLISDGKNETVGVVQIEDGASSSLVSRLRNSPEDPKRLEIGLGCDELLGNDAPESGEISPHSSYVFSSTEMGSGWDQTHFIGKRGSIIDSDSDPDLGGDDKVVHANPTDEKSECSCEEEDRDEELEMIKHMEEKEAIRILKRALEEERTSRAALYVELEKERIAASTAADEAMAMILRLQEEKALREMETRQYRRMVEEKTAYEEEEMTILKEIIVSREREKHFLEKEVEAYRELSASAQNHDEF